MNDKLKMLIESYLKSTKNNLGILQELFIHLCKKTSKLDAVSWQKFRDIVHKLAGSGGTQGFGEISRLARLLEVLALGVLKTGRFDKDMELHAQSILQEFSGVVSNAKAEQSLLLKTYMNDSLIHYEKPSSDIVFVYSPDESYDFSQEMENQFNLFSLKIRTLRSAKEIESWLQDEFPYTVLIVLKKDLSYGFDDLNEFYMLLEKLSRKGRFIPFVGVLEENHIDLEILAVRLKTDYSFVWDAKTFGSFWSRISRIWSTHELQMRILLVDDDEGLLLLYKEILEAAGFRVKIVHRSEWVLEEIDDFFPNLVILDQNMPYITGLELLNLIRRRDSLISVPVIILSAVRDEALDLLGAEAGAEAFLKKPIRGDYLVRFIKAFLKRAHYINNAIYRDSLTGLYNHASFMECIEREFENAKKYNHEMFFAFIDIDYFKSVNDQYGHRVGDEVLQKLANFLRQYVRRNDVVGRCGGEEFGILFTHIQQESVQGVVNRLRKAFKAFKHLVKSKQGYIHVTFSCGICDRRHAKTSRELFENADKILYEAKKQGRDRILFYQPQQN